MTRRLFRLYGGHGWALPAALPVVMFMAVLLLGGCALPPHVYCHGQDAFMRTHRETSNVIRIERVKALDPYCTGKNQ